MSLRPDDPKLSAWLLGELSAEEAVEVERAVAADHALKLASHEIERVQCLLSNTLAPQEVSLFPRQRNMILQEARRLDASSRVVAFPAARQKTPVAWFFPFAAAAVLALACWLLIQLPGGDESQTAGNSKDTKKPTKQSIDATSMPAPAPTESGGSVVVMPATQSIDAHPDFPVLIPRSAVHALENPVLPLPVQAGSKSLDWVTSAIRSEKRLPHPHAVRFEEILNRFPLRPSGTAALAKGVALSAESVACPWKPSAQLLIVSLRGAAGDARDVTVAFQPNAAVVRSYRLLGYSRAQGANDSSLPTHLAAGASHSVVIEVQAENAEASFGSIQWTVNGQSAPVLDVIRRTDTPPSEDARFAALVAACSLWLTDTSSPIDKDALASLIREHRASAASADRADFVQMMDEAMALSTK